MWWFINDFLTENKLFAQFVLLSGLEIYFFWQKYTSQTKYFFGLLSNRSPWITLTWSSMMVSRDSSAVPIFVWSSLHCDALFGHGARLVPGEVATFGPSEADLCTFVLIWHIFFHFNSKFAPCVPILAHHIIGTKFQV